jgi:hypothetical protein
MYGLNQTDIEDVTRNLKLRKLKFEKEAGVMCEESNYRREIYNPMGKDTHGQGR